MPLQLIHALLGEHGAINPLLDLAAARAPDAGLEELRILAICLQATLVSHAGLEDDILRPPIEDHLPVPPPNPDGSPGPTDHDEIRTLLSEAISAEAAPVARGLLLEVVAQTRKHFKKEETRIFQIAERELSREKSEELGAEWASRRCVLLPATELCGASV